MELEKLDKHIKAQNDFILKLQSELRELTLKHTALEAAFHLMTVSIATSSPELGIALKENAENAYEKHAPGLDDFHHLEKHLRILSGKYPEKPLYLKLMKSRKPDELQ